MAPLIPEHFLNDNRPVVTARAPYVPLRQLQFLGIGVVSIVVQNVLSCLDEKSLKKLRWSGLEAPGGYRVFAVRCSDKATRA